MIVYTPGIPTGIRLDGVRLTLDLAQALVGGWVEQFNPRSPDFYGLLLINEEGRLLRLPLNKTAEARWGFPLLGTVVHLETAEEVHAWYGKAA